MFFDEMSKRKQIRWYDENRIPDLSLIQNAVKKAYDSVASKQNLMPYKLYVIAGNHELNQGLYDLSKGGTGTVTANTNLLTAPYQFIYTARLVNDANDKVQSDMDDWGHCQPPCDPNMYKKVIASQATCIEIGMHCTILSKTLIEQGLDISYTRCFENYDSNKDLWIQKGFDFIEDDVYLLMSAGYRALGTYEESGESKPPFENVVKYCY
jgi:hypothetical protein